MPNQAIFLYCRTIFQPLICYFNKNRKYSITGSRCMEDFSGTQDSKPTPEEKPKAYALGRWGEDTAVQYLRDKGYTIVDRNYRKGHLEIDIIAREGDTLVIVEVKTRSSDTFMRPEEAVDHKKQADLLRIANQYVRSHHRTEEVRMDIISIVANPRGTNIEHIKNAFTAVDVRLHAARHN